MLRISPSMGHVLDMNMSLRHLLFLLEYCMVTGYDWWDILLHVQPNMVQNLVEKLHEEYMRQNAALQQVSGRGLSDWEEGAVTASAQRTDGSNCLAVLSLNTLFEQYSRCGEPPFKQCSFSLTLMGLYLLETSGEMVKVYFWQRFWEQ